MSATKKLVIVESPTKMKSIAGYLGDGYEVLSSVGHIRDLAEPKKLPTELKKGSLGKFAVDIDNSFEPYYLVSDAKKKTVAELKRALKDADELLLATDEDREGEAIAWHLLQVLKPTIPVKRMVFHEITKDAILAAKDDTRELNEALVDAQETRRILDRIYGYEISPVLWRKVGPSLSAGRVQSAATRLVVDRERERQAFVPASYWDLTTQVTPEGGESGFEARLVRLDGTRVATGRDFDDTGTLTQKARHLDEDAAGAIASALTDSAHSATVASLETKPYSRRPAAPFTTSTLQQEAARKLRFSARQTMSVAQSLYENGYITYMRTDSVSLSQQATNAARDQARALYGDESVPTKARFYASKSKNAQEAHEAIRPSGDTFRTPGQVKSALRDNDFKLYELIWKRTVASQMADAKGQTATVTVQVPVESSSIASMADLTASGTVITFRGFLAAYEEGTDEVRGDRDKNTTLPQMTEGKGAVLSDIESKGHETTPRPRYTEASLTKRLEELGIGRPSTYAQILSTIVDRGYVSQRGTALVPNWVAFSVVRLLEEHFPSLVEYDFTAGMEEDLDRIAAGEAKRVDWLTEFYFGNDQHEGLRHVVDNLGEIDPRELNSVRYDDSITLRIGRYGPYLEVIDDDAKPDPETGEIPTRRVNIPNDLAPDELTLEKARELKNAPVIGDRELGQNPDTGKTVVVKDGRFGPYVAELEPEPTNGAQTGSTSSSGKAKKSTKKKAPKPRTASLFTSMSPETIELPEALKLLSLPRVVGEDPESGEQITAQNGRYGPYLKRGTDSRSLQTEEQIFDIDVAGALELFAKPKYASRRSASALKEFEADPVSGKPVRVKDGRFGPYVTDGETNVTIPKTDDPQDMTFDRAVQMLADKRAKGPAKKGGAKKSTAKKSTAKNASTTGATKKKSTSTAGGTKKSAAKKSSSAGSSAKKGAATSEASSSDDGSGSVA